MLYNSTPEIALLCVLPHFLLTGVPSLLFAAAPCSRRRQARADTCEVSYWIAKEAETGTPGCSFTGRSTYTLVGVVGIVFIGSVFFLGTMNLFRRPVDLFDLINKCEWQKIKDNIVPGKVREKRKRSKQQQQQQNAKKACCFFCVVEEERR